MNKDQYIGKLEFHLKDQIDSINALSNAVNEFMEKEIYDTGLAFAKGALSMMREQGKSLNIELISNRINQLTEMIETYRVLALEENKTINIEKEEREKAKLIQELNTLKLNK